jgi:hypothetical protein
LCFPQIFAGCVSPAATQWWQEMKKGGLRTEQLEKLRLRLLKVEQKADE